MFSKSITEANYHYLGDSDGFYRTGEMYYLTVQCKRFLWKKHLEVTCRRGGKDQLYEGCTPIVYGDESAFKQDWSKL